MNVMAAALNRATAWKDTAEAPTTQIYTAIPAEAARRAVASAASSILLAA